MGNLTVLIQLLIVAILNNATLPNSQGWIIYNGLFQQISQFIIKMYLPMTTLQKASLTLLQAAADSWQSLKGAAESYQISSVGTAYLYAGKEAFKIIDIFASLLQLLAQEEIFL